MLDGELAIVLALADQCEGRVAADLLVDALRGGAGLDRHPPVTAGNGALRQHRVGAVGADDQVNLVGRDQSLGQLRGPGGAVLVVIDRPADVHIAVADLDLAADDLAPELVGVLVDLGHALIGAGQRQRCPQMQRLCLRDGGSCYGPRHGARGESRRALQDGSAARIEAFRLAGHAFLLGFLCLPPVAPGLEAQFKQTFEQTASRLAACRNVMPFRSRRHRCRRRRFVPARP